MTKQLTIASLLLALLTGCSGGGSGIDAAGAGNGIEAGLSVRLAADQRTSGNQVSEMANIFASIAFVTAHAAGPGGWRTISETPTVVDLLRLGDHAEELGFANLPDGRITQIRLYVADDGQSHAVTNDGDDRVLRVPSGIESGIKLKGPFELGECEYGTAVAYADLEKSILIHGRGNNDDWQLRPVIKRVTYEAGPAECPPEGGGEGEVPPGEGEVPPAGGDGEVPPGGGDGEVPPVDEGGVGDPGDGDGEVGDPVPGDDVPQDPGTGVDGGGDAGGDPGDECAPVLTDEGGLINPCTGEVVPIG